MSHPNLVDTTPQTIIRRAWYAVAESKQVTAKTPTRATLCDVPLVLFRDKTQTIRALDAMCPHRGADLSKGTIKNGCVVCPYHGWRFDGQGQCTHVPTAPEHESKATVRQYRALEQDGFIWVCLLDDDAIPRPPRLNALDTKGMSTFWVDRKIPLPMLWWAENMLDVTHVPFTHASTFGGDAAPLQTIEVVAYDQPLSGFRAKIEMTQSYNWLTRLLYKQRTPMMMHVTIHHWMPGVTCFEVKLNGGKRTQLLWSIVSPIDDTTCVTWLGIGRDYWNIPGLGWLTDGIGRWFSRRVLDEDQRLGEQAMIAPTTLHMKHPQSVAADAPCLAFIKMSRKLLAQEQQLDRVPQDAHDTT